MSDQFKGIEPMVYNSKINVPYSWWAGDTASKFYLTLRDEKKITGTKCTACNKVFLPPRKVCPLCFTENAEWVNISDEGTVLTFSVARRQLAAIPQDRKVPVIWGLIKLDGADTGITHFIDEVDIAEIKFLIVVKRVF